jgi:hypothetical protein
VEVINVPLKPSSAYPELAALYRRNPEFVLTSNPSDCDLPDIEKVVPDIEFADVILVPSYPSVP